ncbi:MAG: hypothetical protein PHH70_00710 [Candidatus Gracilibacteria bacterium]|nr:hypothetical protein [Candidatus Gracilibacteria bacterium]
MTEKQQNQPQSVHSRSELGRVFGILSIVFGVIGIIGPGIIFFPLALISSIVALLKKEYMLGGVGSILALIVLILSPSIWGTMILFNNANNYQKKVDNQAKAIIESRNHNTTISTPADPYGVSNSKPKSASGQNTVDIY